MPQFNFHHDLEVRFADIDALQHVNHARYFTYMESARVAYMLELGLRAGPAWKDLGIILAHASCEFKRPIQFGQSVRVGVAAVRLGQKSFELAYQIEAGGHNCADGRTVQVAFNYDTGESIDLPNAWRDKLVAFEPGLEPPL